MNTNQRANQRDGQAAFEQRIRERAHQIWMEEGQPEGREDAHWEMARELVAQQDGQHLATEPNPAAKGKQRARGDESAEPLQAVENLGDLPGALTDQGDRQAYPKPRPTTRRRK